MPGNHTQESQRRRTRRGIAHGSFPQGKGRQRRAATDDSAHFPTSHKKEPDTSDHATATRTTHHVESHSLTLGAHVSNAQQQTPQCTQTLPCLCRCVVLLQARRFLASPCPSVALALTLATLTVVVPVFLWTSLQRRACEARLGAARDAH